MIDAIIGSAENRVDLPNPARLAWDLCPKFWPFDPAACGPQPSGIIRMTVDTRTGARAEIATAGRVGLQLDYLLDAGSVTAAFDYAPTLSLPERVRRGEAFDLVARETLLDGSMTTLSPTIEASADLVAELTAEMGGGICIALAGCAVGRLPVVDIDATAELLAIDGAEIRVLDGILPDFLPSSIELDGAETVFEYDVIEQTVNAKVRKKTGAPISVGALPVGLGIEIATVTASLPNVETKARLEAGAASIASEGSAEIISAKLDVDSLLSVSQPQFLPGGFSVDAFGMAASFDIFDAGFGPELDLE